MSEKKVILGCYNYSWDLKIKDHPSDKNNPNTMVIVSILSNAEFRRNDHREYALHFMLLTKRLDEVPAFLLLDSQQQELSHQTFLTRVLITNFGVPMALQDQVCARKKFAR